MTLRIEFDSKFKKDLKRIRKRGKDGSKLWEVVQMLAEGRKLPDKHRDHALKDSRNYKNMRECHIEPDWLLIYKIKGDELALACVRTGTHSDLF